MQQRTHVNITRPLISTQKVYSAESWEIGVESHRKIHRGHVAPHRNSGKKGSIRLTSVVLARRNSRTEHRMEPRNKKVAPAEKHGTWRKRSTSSKTRTRPRTTLLPMHRSRRHPPSKKARGTREEAEGPKLVCHPVDEALTPPPFPSFSPFSPSLFSLFPFSLFPLLHHMTCRPLPCLVKTVPAFQACAAAHSIRVTPRTFDSGAVHMLSKKCFLSRGQEHHDGSNCPWRSASERGGHRFLFTTLISS